MATLSFVEWNMSIQSKPEHTQKNLQQVNWLQTHFINGLTTFDVAMSQQQKIQLWQGLQQHYSQPQRHYHTLQHIFAMCQYYEQLKQQLHEPMIVLLAIYYHDVVYDAKRIDNEQQSCELFNTHFLGILSPNVLSKVSEMIMLTQKHQLPTDTPKHTSPSTVATLITKQKQDAAYFLDMDLSILGQAQQHYQNYANAIRQEYQHVIDSLYHQGRTKVLQQFLTRPRLFFTDYFYQRFEQQARRNIALEIQSLCQT